MVDRESASEDRHLDTSSGELVDIYHSLDSFVSDRIKAPLKAQKWFVKKAAPRNTKSCAWPTRNCRIK